MVKNDLFTMKFNVITFCFNNINYENFQKNHSGICK